MEAAGIKYYSGYSPIMQKNKSGGGGGGGGMKSIPGILRFFLQRIQMWIYLQFEMNNG